MRRFTLVVGLACAAAAVVTAQSGITGKWQGSTPSGRQTITLDVKATEQELTGTLALNDQSGKISEGKVDDKTFSFVATVEGKTVTFKGRLLDANQIELTPQGMGGPATLTRVMKR